MKISNEGGFSVLEVILASAIFMIFAISAVGVLLQGFTANRSGVEETVANQFASEGIEAVKSIKNQSFSSLVNSAGTGVDRVGNVWVFGGTNDILTHNSNDDYIRTITVSDIQRDCSGNIVASGGIVDANTKKITSNVIWNPSPGRSNSTNLVTYLSDWKKPITFGVGPIMMAYSKTTTIPFYRMWDGSSWSAEAPAQTVGGNINYIVLKSSRTRNEAVLGTMDSNGNIYAQVWNGSCWGTPTLIANIGSSLSIYRSFDIEYEKNTDRAMIVYLPNSTSVDPASRIWDGGNWLSPTIISAPPTTGVVRWIDIAQNPISTSNEIAMIMLDANVDIYGMAWDGSSWSNMGTAAVWDASASIATEKSIAVAYEQISGRSMFIWGDATATDQYYRIWNGSALTASTLLDIPASGGAANWIRLVSRPSSDELMYGVLDQSSDINTRKWSGSAWDTAAQHPEHTAGAENNSSMVFDIVWETHSSNPGKAWLLMANNNRLEKKQWSGSAWNSAAILTGSDDTSFIKLKADPNSGAIFAGIYEDSASGTDDIWESRLTEGGTTWNAKNIIWGGPTAGTPVYFRIDIAVP